jgi:hypothetical protein
MSAITYTAKRRMEPTGYAKSGVDISVSGTDDSFNASSTVLTGLLDNQWVLTAGCVNSANNGWFQANGNSTSTKITQDTTISLVTESAGPAITLTGYVRGLGQSYSFNLPGTKLDRSAKADSNSQTPMGGGAAEVMLMRIDEFDDITTGFITNTSTPSLLQMREFIESVMGGEIFIFDKYGTVAVPVEARQVQLDSDSYSESRIGSLYNYQLSFRVRYV